MLAEKVRRILVRTLVLALAGGLVAHSMPTSIAGSKAPATAVAMSMDMPTDMPVHGKGKCDGCAGNEKGLMPTACSAFCASVVTLPQGPIVLAADPIGKLLPAAGTVMTGCTGPPDPYPPRPSVLS
jgi:hypothetical protein